MKMAAFILPLIAIIVAVVTLVLSIISFFKEGHNGRFGIGSTIGSIVVTIIGSVCFEVPTPTIYPLNNEAKIYEGKLEIYIDTIKFPFLNTYYSLDGTNPEEGYVYQAPFTINETTTIVAENKFLWQWSKPDNRTYKFESIPITYSGELDLLISDKLPSARELLDYAIYGIIFIVIIITLIRRAWQNLRDWIKNLLGF